MPSRRGPDNSVRVTIQGTCDSVNWANVFHAQLTTGGSIAQADLDTWTTSFQADYKTRFAGFINNQVGFSLAKTILYTPGGGELISSIAMTGAGTVATGTGKDASGAKCISWLTTVYWRGGKPRTYLPGTSVAEMANELQIAGATVTALTTAAANFRTDINALAPASITGTQLGFVSFFSGNALRGTPLFFAYTGAKVHPRIASQRRRLGKWQN